MESKQNRLKEMFSTGLLVVTLVLIAAYFYQVFFTLVE